MSLHKDLMRRLALLRQTALPIFFPATKATRPERSCCFSFRNTRIITSGVLTRLPSLKRVEISELDFMTSNAYEIKR